MKVFLGVHMPWGSEFAIIKPLQFKKKIYYENGLYTRVLPERFV